MTPPISMLIATSVIVSLTIVLLMSSIIFLPKISLGKVVLSTFWMVTLIGAIILLAIQSVSIKTVWESFTSSSTVNPLKILVLFIAMTSLSVYLDQLGFFSFMAGFFAKKFSKSQYLLFFGLYVVISVLTVFTSNDIIILTFTPFICYFCKRNHIKPIPYLMMEFVAANTWSVVLIIGNPTNIYLASDYSLPFFGYFVTMLVPALGASLISLGILFLLFHRSLKEPCQYKDEPLPKLERTPLLVGLVLLSCCTVLLAISGYINLPMWIVAAGFALVLILFLIVESIVQRQNKVFPLLKNLPWNLIPFLISMFIIVLAMDQQGILKAIQKGLLALHLPDALTFGFSGAIACNLINNIPMAVLYGSLLSGQSLKAVYGTLIASNIAAYITPLGALAGIMFLSLVRQQDIRLSFLDFTKYGAACGIPAVTVALVLLQYLP